MVFKRFFRWALRPQLLAASVVILLVIGGALASPPEVKTVTPVKKEVLTTDVIKKPDCVVQACIALTFDDGPDKTITPVVLDILKRHNAHATFFVQGSRVQGNEEILRRIHAEGHEIGNHSWGHPYFTRISPEQVQNEIISTQQAISKAGVPAPQLFRPPYGDINAAVVSQIPLTVVRWNVDPEDWRPKKQPLLLEHMAAHARPGSVVVMHDTEATTAERLEPLLVQLEAGHYSFVTVSELLNITPGQRGVYFNR